MIEQLNHKNILFISNTIFGYEKKIKKYLEDCGAHVDYYNDRPSDNVFEKLFVRKGFKFYRGKIKKYYHQIVDSNIDKDYDYVFFMRCETPYPEELQYMKEKFPHAKFYLYLSDAIINLPNYEIKKGYFDRICSFDSQDCQSHPEMIFRPLFYTTSYQDTDHYDYDVTFIGTLHTDRGVVCEKILEQSKKDNFRTYFRLYVQSPVIFIFRWLLSSNVRRMYKMGYITLEKMASSEVHDIENRSKCVLDVEHTKQSGLTLRNVELVGMGKKVVTSNYRIKDYDFYNENNIVIMDRHNPYIDPAFFDKKYVKPSEDIYQKYSLEYWIKDVFNFN